MTAIEQVDRRYLAGFRVEDAATGAPVRAALRVQSDAARFFRTSPGVYVVSSAAGLEAHRDAFDTPPNLPAVESVPIEISIRDDAGLYFPRLFTLALPRNPAPGAPNSVFELVRVALYRSLGASFGPNWGVLYGTLVDPAGVPLRNALLRVVQESNDALLGVGLVMSPGNPSDARGAVAPRRSGQLAIPLVGIPAVTWSATAEGSVLVSSVSVRLEIVAISASVDVFDPDDFITAEGITAGPFNVASGRRENVGVLEVTVPS